MSVELVSDNSGQQSLDMPMPVARIRGEAMSEMPTDLFIPPDALSVILEQFEGPLDLLLYLIRRHSLDILDIPMAELTRQYMVYVEGMRETRLELAAEYLLMAAMLIEIKSRMLLPRPPRENEVEAEDPRAELVRRLLEYEQIKAASQALDRMPRRERDFTLVEVLVEQSLVARVAAGGPDRCLARHPCPRAKQSQAPRFARGIVGACAHEPHPARAGRQGVRPV